MPRSLKLRKKSVTTSKGKRHYACVRYQGKDHMMGRYGSREARQNYNRFMAEINADEPVATSGMTVTDIAIDYAKFARTYYRKRGKLTTEYHAVQQGLRELRKLYGDTLAAEFGPKRFKTVRQVFIDRGLTRKTVNHYALHIVRAFRKGAENQLIGSEVYQSLVTVERLRAGRTAAKEGQRIPPADEALIQAAIGKLPAIVADMLRLQLLTGMRPNEVCNIRPADIDTSGEVWVYVPETHKTEHHGASRTIVVGPTGQAILKPYLMRDAETYCFNPKETVEQVRRAAALNRKTPASCGNRPGSNRKRKPKREPGDKYTSESYRKAIHRACDRAFPVPEAITDEAEIKRHQKAHRFNPNQVRKTAATKIRKSTASLEAAQLVLGHASKRTTEKFYASLMVSDEAIEVMKELG